MRPIPLLLLTAALALAGVGCEKIGDFEYANFVDAVFSFSFGASAPYWGEVSQLGFNDPGVYVWGRAFANRSEVRLASGAQSALWDRDLVYTVRVRYFDGSWVLGRYKCNDTNGYIYFFYKVEQEPPVKTATFTFTVPRDKASHRDSRTVRAAVPPQYVYSPVCRDIVYHTSGSGQYPSCVLYDRDNYAAASGPHWWNAKMVNGVPAGGEYSAYGVTVKMPNPWAYAGHLTLTTDLGGGRFLSSVRIDAFGEPAEWGEIVFKPPRPVPLYFSRVVKLPAQSWWSLADPPEVFLVDVEGNATWVGDRWVWNFTLASVALKTPFWLRPYVAVGDLVNKEIRIKAPLGSVIRAEVSLLWMLDMGERRAWIASYPTSLRIADSDSNFLDYEELGRRKKLVFSIDSAYGSPKGINPASVAMGIDESTPVVETAWYSHPYPCSQWPSPVYRCVYAQHVYTKVNGTWVGYSRVGPRGAGWPLNKIVLVDFLGLNNWFSGGGDGDVMKLLWGDPVLYFWHVYRTRCWLFNPQTGDWDIPYVCVHWPPHPASLAYEVYGHEQYKNTTRSPSPADKLYHVKAGPFEKAHTGVADSFFVNTAPGFADATPLGGATIVTDPGLFLLSLIPTTACREPICLRVNAELWGPAPPPTPDLALPGAGYSFMFTWLNKSAYADVKIYVEMGHVVYPDGLHKEVDRNAPVVQISKRWSPLETIFAGPGWWISYRPLGPCEALGLGSKAVYVTPLGWAGPIKIVVEINNTRYEGAFVVSDDVSLAVDTATPAPETISTLGLIQNVSFFLAGAPYFHGLYGLGEGGRQYPFTCTPARTAAKTQYGGDVWTDASQLTVSGDFWGFIQLWGVVKVEDAYSRPKFEIADWSRGLVKITADGPVYGFAFYLQRDGKWVKIGEVSGRCVLVNASRIFPWDPVRVLPLVSQSVRARIGDTITLWRPVDRLLFKTWADGVGYPKGARSELQIVGTC
ncbi:hypothetical protein Pogu_0611 [Pyrobaculum oguniense TE7]|uniref:Uncharacterized protein n=1 Tax=Pyrobaculum oguniense (strain DSM 13380 / JCM 10595 / TE7) TaxID=698757 RepID=H6Q7Y1_PYROT|nr:hypothetical protein Pogu_0611 [Pyrobaculum oguniense TE7]